MKQKKEITKEPVVKLYPLEEFSEQLEMIGSAARTLLNESKLKLRAIHLLIQDITGLPIGTISKVLVAASELDKTYLKR